MGAREFGSHQVNYFEPQFFGMQRYLLDSFCSRTVVNDDSMGIERMFSGLKLRLHEQHKIRIWGNRKHAVKH
jgi:hypothetical protein